MMGTIAGLVARALLMLLLLVLVTIAIRAVDAQASGQPAMSNHLAECEGSLDYVNCSIPGT